MARFTIKIDWECAEDRVDESSLIASQDDWKSCSTYKESVDGAQCHE